MGNGRKENKSSFYLKNTFSELKKKKLVEWIFFIWQKGDEINCLKNVWIIFDDDSLLWNRYWDDHLKKSELSFYFYTASRNTFSASRHRSYLTVFYKVSVKKSVCDRHADSLWAGDLLPAPLSNQKLTSITSRSSLLLCAARPCMQLNCWGLAWRMPAPELLMNWPESSVPDTDWTSKVFPRGPRSLEESTTMGSVLGSISASIMEIFRMSDTDGLSPEGPELDSGSSLAVASPLLNTGVGWWELPKVILVTVALWVMIGCCGRDI